MFDLKNSKLEKHYTVKEIVDKVLSWDNEWGTIIIELDATVPPSSYKIEYEKGKLIFPKVIEEIPSEIINRTVASIMSYNRSSIDIILTLENNDGCDCCAGDEALCWLDDENNVFIDGVGEVMTTIEGNVIRYRVKHCPNCGRKFE